MKMSTVFFSISVGVIGFWIVNLWLWAFNQPNLLSTKIFVTSVVTVCLFTSIGMILEESDN